MSGALLQRVGVQGSSTPPLTPTTWDPAFKSADMTLSNGNLTAAKPIINSAALVRCIGIKTSGKWYIEHTVNVVTSPFFMFGLINASATTGNNLTQANTFGFEQDGQVWSNGVLKTSGATFTTSDVLCQASDLDNNKVWWRVNGGNWDNNGTHDPATNVGGYDVSAMKSTGVYAAFSPNSAPGAATTNFGATAFSFTVPTGFTAGWG